MIARAPHRPWMPDETRPRVLGRIVVKLAAGYELDHVPHPLDGPELGAAALSLDGGRVDRAIRRRAGGHLVTRVHRALAQLPDRRGGWDELECTTGMSRTFRVDLDPQTAVLPLCEELRSLAHVEQAAPEYLCVTPFGVEAPHREDAFAAHRMVRAPEALAFEPGDTTLVVGVVDSGLDSSHGEIAGRFRPGVDFVDLQRDRLAQSVELVGDTADPDRSAFDDMGHGTSCAGIIAARGLNVPPGLGGACWVLAGRALAAARIGGRGTLSAVGATEDISAALKRVVDLGARVVNMSFGTPASALRNDDPIPHEDVVEYALRRGVILVAASGNDGSVAKYYPAAIEGVLAVGAVSDSGRPSAFSTRGDHVALCAPGESVAVATFHGRYARASGTSFAAPFVTATCALLAARSARYGVPLTHEAARDALLGTARRFPAGVETEGCGAGVLDARAAVEALERSLRGPSKIRGDPAGARLIDRASIDS